MPITHNHGLPTRTTHQQIRVSQLCGQQNAEAVAFALTHLLCLTSKHSSRTQQQRQQLESERAAGPHNSSGHPATVAASHSTSRVCLDGLGPAYSLQKGLVVAVARVARNLCSSLMWHAGCIFLQVQEGAEKEEDTTG